MLWKDSRHERSCLFFETKRITHSMLEVSAEYYRTAKVYTLVLIKFEPRHKKAMPIIVCRTTCHFLCRLYIIMVTADMEYQ